MCLNNFGGLRLLGLGCLALILGLMTGCSAVVKAAYLELLPLQGFETLETDRRVHYEPLAKASAELLSASYSDAVKQIEIKLGGPLRTMPKVYLCANDACYEKYAFNKQARAEARGRGNLILLKAKLLEDEGRLIPVFTHELVYAFWFQNGIHCTPRWWTEGLAVESSNGGGAEKIMRLLAVQAVRDGEVFQASNENSCWTRMPPNLNGMAWPMFYRQSGMFVEWMRTHDAKAFALLLVKLRDGDNLTKTIESVYRQPVTALHLAWQKTVH